jgi:hypothetical protein
MWRVVPIDLGETRGVSGRQLWRSAYAVAVVGVLVVGCSAQTASAPSPLQSSPPVTSAHTTPSSDASLTFTSSVAPFTLPAPVSRPTVFSEGQGLLVVGGLTTADTTTQQILLVDVSHRTVKTAGQHVPVHDAAGAVVGGKDLVFGGGSTTVSSAVQDVTPGGSTQVISHLPQPRADLVAISDGKAGYVLGGFDGTQGSTTVLRTLDGRAFTVMGTLPLSVRYPAIAATAGSIWLFGGEHDGKQITEVQRIDLSTGQGTIAGPLPRPLAHAGAFTLQGMVLVAGGRSSATTTATLMRFDPSNASFSTAGHLPDARSDFGVAVVGGTAYLVGGESPKPVDTVIQVRAQAGGTS